MKDKTGQGILLVPTPYPKTKNCWGGPPIPGLPDPAINGDIDGKYDNNTKRCEKIEG